MYVFKEPSEFSFKKLGIKGRKFFINDLSTKVGVVFVETKKGHETTIINHVCDVLYYIIGGTGYFEINGKKEDFSKGDLVVIPAESKFTYKGHCKMLRITAPPFYPEQEETL